MLTTFNLVDKVMESCFQLLSLFFLTIGRNHEAPATYALTSTIKRLLDHLTEVDLYSEKDLESIRDTLQELSASLDQGSEENEGAAGQHSPYLLTLVRNRVELCQEMTDFLQKRLDRFSECLKEKHEKLISILRTISLANTKSKVGVTWHFTWTALTKVTTQFSTSEVRRLQKQLLEVGESQVDGKFCAADGSIPAGSEEVSELYNRCVKWSEMVLER